MKCTAEKGSVYTSSVGSSFCDMCIDQNYMLGRECISCPDGAKCNEGTTLANMWIEEGYFRFTAESTHVYECPVPENW